MAYTTPADVRKVMRKLPSSVTDLDIQFHIEKATSYLNGLLGGVFVVPFLENNVPPLIKHVTTDLTVFFLAEDLYSSQKPNMDEYQEKRYKRVMDMIGDIIDGSLYIGVDPIRKSGFDSTNLADPIFTMENPYW